jgi:hypothetical protein
VMITLNHSTSISKINRLIYSFHFMFLPSVLYRSYYRLKSTFCLFCRAKHLPYAIRYWKSYDCITQK